MKFEKIKERLFKPIPKLDAEIRTIENEQYEDESIYWVVEIGLCESMGERGYNFTLFYDEKPIETEIIKDIKIHIEEQIHTFQSKVLGGTEGKQLETLRRIE